MTDRVAGLHRPVFCAAPAVIHFDDKDVCASRV